MSEKFEFPEEFQNTLLSLAVYSTEFLRNAREILEPEHFSTREQWTVCTLAYEYFDKYGKAPKTNIKQAAWRYARKTNMKAERAELIGALINTLDPVVGPTDYALTEIRAFIQHTETRRALEDFLPKFKAGNYNLDELTNTITGIQKSAEEIDEGDETDMLAESRDRAHSRILAKKSKYIATLIDVLDERYVGIRPTQLGTIIAPSGIGKTTFAVHLAKAGAMQGEQVIFYTFETPKEELEEMFDRVMAGVRLDDLGTHRATRKIIKVSQMIANQGGKIRVVYQPEPTLEDWMKRMKSDRKKYGRIGMYIADYGECIEGDHSENTYLDAKTVWSTYKTWLVEEKAAGYIMSQAAIGAVGAKRITEQHRSDSYWKIRKSDIVMGFNRNMLYNEKKHEWLEEDEENNPEVVRLFMIKHRGRADKYDIRFASDLDRGMMYSKKGTREMTRLREQYARNKIGAETDVT